MKSLFIGVLLFTVLGYAVARDPRVQVEMIPMTDGGKKIIFIVSLSFLLSFLQFSETPHRHRVSEKLRRGK
jgi:hypothetical protein